MNSRQRRMLHLFLRDSGLRTASSGEGPSRFVVLYPEGYRIPQENTERPSIRSSYARQRGERSRGPRSRSAYSGRS